MWITLIGAAHAVAFNKHFCVDFVLSRFSQANQAKLGWVISACVFAFAAIMIWFGAYVTWRTRFQVSPALYIPMCYPYLCIPLSGLFVMVHLVAKHFPGADDAARTTAEGWYAE